MSLPRMSLGTGSTRVAHTRSRVASRVARINLFITFLHVNAGAKNTSLQAASLLDSRSQSFCEAPFTGPRPSDEGWEGADWPSCAAGGGEGRPRSDTDAGAASSRAGCSCTRRRLQRLDEKFAGMQPAQPPNTARKLVCSQPLRFRRFHDQQGL